MGLSETDNPTRQDFLYLKNRLQKEGFTGISFPNEAIGGSPNEVWLFEQPALDIRPPSPYLKKGIDVRFTGAATFRPMDLNKLRIIQQRLQGNITDPISCTTIGEIYLEKLPGGLLRVNTKIHGDPKADPKDPRWQPWVYKCLKQSIWSSNKEAREYLSKLFTIGKIIGTTGDVELLFDQNRYIIEKGKYKQEIVR